MIHNLSLCRLKKSKHNFFIQLKKPNKPKKPPKPTAVRRQTPARVNVKNPTNTKHLTLNRSKYTVCVRRVYREAYKYKQEIKGSEHQLCSQRMYRSRLTKLISSGMKSHGDSELSLPSVPSFISPSSSSRGRTSRWCHSLLVFKKSSSFVLHSILDISNLVVIVSCNRKHSSTFIVSGALTHRLLKRPP